MYIPPKFKETDSKVLHDFIQHFPLGTLVNSNAGSINAEHIPFYLKQLGNNEIRLQSHIARANPLWKNCSDGEAILLIFHGPNAYISPNFYPSKQETGKAVPTWNYSVVHVEGRIYFKHESSWVLQLLKELSDLHETGQHTPWSVSDAPAGYTEKLLKAVVGLEIVVDNIVGNFKLSQNKASTDYAGVVDGLSSSENSTAMSVAQMMRESTNH